MKYIHGYTHSVLANTAFHSNFSDDKNRSAHTIKINLLLEVIRMPRTKTAQVLLRFTPAEKENLLRRAAEARMSMSKYILALSEQKKIYVIDGLPELIVQIIKIGTNVNQVAFVANMYKSVSLEQIAMLRNDLNEVEQLLKKLILTVAKSKDRVKV